MLMSDNYFLAISHNNFHNNREYHNVLKTKKKYTIFGIFGIFLMKLIHTIQNHRGRSRYKRKSRARGMSQSKAACTPSPVFADPPHKTIWSSF